MSLEMNRTEENISVLDRNSLIEQTMLKAEVFARSIAHKFAVPSNYLDDVIASAYLGLVEAAESYNHENGYQCFLSYSYLYVKGRVLREFRSLSGVSRAMLRWIKAEKESVDKAMSSLEAVRDHVCSGETAKAVRIGVVMEYAQTALMNTALERSMTPDGDIVSHRDKDPEAEVGDRQVALVVEEAIKNALTDEDRLILRLRYQEDKRFAEIAKVLNLSSRGTVSRRHQVIVDKIRSYLKSKDHSAYHFE